MENFNEDVRNITRTLFKNIIFIADYDFKLDPKSYSNLHSFRFAFPDDTYFRLTCTKDKKVSVEIQAQARLGRGDFGVNRDRVVDLIDYLQHKSIQAADCVENTPVSFSKI